MACYRLVRFGLVVRALYTLTLLFSAAPRARSDARVPGGAALNLAHAVAMLSKLPKALQSVRFMSVTSLRVICSDTVDVHVASTHILFVSGRISRLQTGGDGATLV